MSEVFLGIIAVAVAVMAIIQVAAIVFAARAARSVGEAVSQFQQDVRPIVANLQTLSADVARTTAAASAQVERAQKTVDAVLTRVDAVGARVEQTVQCYRLAFSHLHARATPSCRRFARSFPRQVHRARRHVRARSAPKTKTRCSSAEDPFDVRL